MLGELLQMARPKPPIQADVSQFLKLAGNAQPFSIYLNIVHRYALILNDDRSSNKDKRTARSQIDYFNHSFITVASLAGVNLHVRES